MVERVVVPVLDAEGAASRLSQHFGRAPYFAVVEFDNKGEMQQLEFKPNISEHFGGRGRPPTMLLSLEPNTVITFGMGPRALRIFQSSGIAVMQATTEILGDVLNAFTRNELRELTEGCRDARHK